MISNEQIVNEILEAMEKNRVATREVNDALSHAYNILNKKTVSDEQIYTHGYSQGLDAVAKACKRICENEDEGGLTVDELQMLFGNPSPTFILTRFSMNKIIDIVSEYDKKKVKKNNLSKDDVKTKSFTEIKPHTFTKYNDKFALVLEIDNTKEIPLSKIITEDGKVLDVPVTSLERAYNVNIKNADPGFYWALMPMFQSLFW